MNATKIWETVSSLQENATAILLTSENKNRIEVIFRLAEDCKDSPAILYSIVEYRRRSRRALLAII